MTTIELLKVDPYITRLPYTLYARIEESDGKITGMKFKSCYNRLKFKR